MRISARTTLSKAALAATALALVGSGALAAPAEASPASNTSANWLADQLDGGLVVSEFNLHDGNGWQQYTDYGLTLDVYLALEALEVKPAKQRAIINAIEPEYAEYTDAFGTRYAGAIGKLLTAAELAGKNPTTYTSENLVEGLEDLVVTTGDEEGRAKDDPVDFDTSNTFGQAFVATALSGAESDLADEATLFLLKQQCSEGFFREDMTSSDFTCDGGTAQQSRRSVDATATAAIALAVLAEDGPQSIRDEAQQGFSDAIAWLVDRQRGDGAFVGNGVANSNSAGLAASAFVVAGRNAKARQAAQWINDLRVTKRLVRTTGFKPADLGAIAYTRAAFASGRADGIARAARYEWRRATAQAAPALDLVG